MDNIDFFEKITEFGLGKLDDVPTKNCCQKNLMAQLLHIYRRIMIWMAVAGSVNVKVAVKVVRDKAGLHQIRGEQLRGPGRYPDSTRHHTQENVS